MLTLGGPDEATTMPAFRSLLYREFRLYDLVFPDSDETGRPDVEDYAEYRLLFPEEVQRMLETGGFHVLGMYDNREFEPTDLTGRSAPDVGGMRGRKLYAFARKR